MNRKAEEKTNTVTVPEGVDLEVLAKVLGNPKMMALLSLLIKSLSSV